MRGRFCFVDFVSLTMSSFFALLKTKRATVFLILLVLVLFVGAALFRLTPMEGDLLGLINSSDDWGRYAVHALDIKQNGWLIPSVTGIYEGPGGFLYNYFIGLCFILCGDNVLPVYLLQNIMLGFSVIFLYLAFRKRMSDRTAFIFLLVLIAFAFVDVFKYYSFQLLSENLGLFLLSAAVFFYLRGTEKGKYGMQMLAALCFGLAASTRPNLFPIALMLLPVIIYYYFKYRRQELLKGFCLVLILVAAISMLAVRNYMQTKHWVFLPALGIADTSYQTDEFSVVFLFKKLAYALGYLPVLDERYQMRPHWFVMWAGYIVCLFYFFRSKTERLMSDWLIHGFIFFYYLLTILFVYVISYGFRAFVPVTFIVLAYAFIGFDRIIITKKL